MRKVFWFCWLAMTGVMAILIHQRYKLEQARHEFEELRLRAEQLSAEEPGISPPAGAMRT